MKKEDSLFKLLHPEDNVIGAGSYGVIYDNYDGTATKVIRAKTLAPDVLIKIKELNLENFYKILGINIGNNAIGKPYVKAYRMNIIKDDNKFLINSDIDFFITNVNVLLNGLKVLSENYILANDLHSDNLIVNNEGINVIDCDLYKYIPEYTQEMIYNDNISKLHEAIKDLLLEELQFVSKLRLLKRIKLKNLFEEKTFEEIYKELENSNSILEYIKK